MKYVDIFREQEKKRELNERRRFPLEKRLKENIELADLDQCYENIKKIPLKRYRWKNEVYNDIYDRTKIGWIAQDVETIFPKSVSQSFMFDIEDCRHLNSDQIIAAMFGTIQKMQMRMEALEARLNFPTN